MGPSAARRVGRSAVLVWIVCTAGSAAAAQTDVFGAGHVRSADAAVQAWLRIGYERSVTFRSLVDDIGRLPGIVYVAQIRALSNGMEGALLHTVSGSPTLPILRVVLQTNLSGDRAVSVLAHELQHVVEALASQRSSDASSLSALFMDLDATHTPGAAHFETERAKQIAAKVLEELRAR